MIDTDEIYACSDPLVASELFLRKLKASTAELHQALEDHPSIGAIMLPEVTKAEYCFYLQQMQRVIATYEEHFLPLAADIYPVNEHTTLELINNDLAALSCTAVELKPYNPAPAVTKPYALGYMYVVEGSRLGGRVILKHLERTLGYTAEYGASYLAGHGAETGRKWKSFLSRLSGYVISNSGIDDTINGANDAFISIRKYFELNRK